MYSARRICRRSMIRAHPNAHWGSRPRQYYYTASWNDLVDSRGFTNVDAFNICTYIMQPRRGSIGRLPEGSQSACTCRQLTASYRAGALRRTRPVTHGLRHFCGHLQVRRWLTRMLLPIGQFSWAVVHRAIPPASLAATRRAGCRQAQTSGVADAGNVCS